MNTERVLIVEDEPDVLEILRFLFASEGYQVQTACDAIHARALVREREPDIVLLDVELPGESGLEFCREMKRDRLPIIMISSHDRDDEVVAGLETGADDYVRKPFHNRELLIRVRKLLDRHHRTDATVSFSEVRIGDLCIDREEARVWRNGQEIVLTPIEWNILDTLVARRGSIVSVAELLRIVWHATEWDGGAEMVKIGIRRLRRKIELDVKKPALVLNRRSRGYYVPDH